MQKSKQNGLRRFGLFATIMLLSSVFAQAGDAQKIAICGSSHGYAYHPKAGLAAVADPKHLGWQEDRISKGSFTLTKVADKKYDLLITDSTGRVFSATQDGGRVIPLSRSRAALTFLVAYPATSVSEIYTFFRNAEGKAKAMWTSNKAGMRTIMKISAMQSECSYLSF